MKVINLPWSLGWASRLLSRSSLPWFFSKRLALKEPEAQPFFPLSSCAVGMSAVVVPLRGLTPPQAAPSAWRKISTPSSTIRQSPAGLCLQPKNFLIAYATAEETALGDRAKFRCANFAPPGFTLWGDPPCIFRIRNAPPKDCPLSKRGVSRQSHHAHHSGGRLPPVTVEKYRAECGQLSSWPAICEETPDGAMQGSLCRSCVGIPAERAGGKNARLRTDFPTFGSLPGWAPPCFGYLLCWPANCPASRFNARFESKE